MEVSAKLSSKGQITLPRAVRDALGVKEGDTVLFRVHDGRATVAATVDLLDLAGVVSVPDDVRGIPWDEIRQRAWRQRGEDLAGR